MRLPTIGVLISITNPKSSSYLAYLASAESWAKVADQLIIVDGWSDDDSIETLKNWISDWSNIKIVKTPHTLWGKCFNFHAAQQNVSYDIGIQQLDTDWVFAVGADQVLDVSTANNLRQQLSCLNEYDILGFYRSKYNNGIVSHKIDSRGIVINIKKVRKENRKIGWGEDKSVLTDFPIDIKEKSVFIDQINNTHKIIYRGLPLKREKNLDIECVTIGHFFFNIEQCIFNCKRWDMVMARYYGNAPKRNEELRLSNKLYGIKKYFSKNQLLKFKHLPEIKRVIEKFYLSGMLGGAVSQISPNELTVANKLRKVLGLERYLHTNLLKLKGYKGLKDLHKWVSLDEPDPEPVDVAKVYAEQNKFLPDWAKI